MTSLMFFIFDRRIIWQLKQVVANMKYQKTLFIVLKDKCLYVYF